MDSTRQLLEHLLQGRDLEEAEAARLLGELTAGELQPAMAGALLAALRAKGVTPPEVRGFAGAMRALARKPLLPVSPDAIDIVGTGGDSSGSLNLSTGSALLAAACGVPVIKHGNRSISSRCGSADLVEQLGLVLPLDEQRAAECFAATGFTFLFAPYFHPAMKALAPIRAALGVRTVFNLLGPLTNPAAPRYQLIGAYDEAAAELIANTLVGMLGERAWVVHGAAGWDEATPDRTLHRLRRGRGTGAPRAHRSRRARLAALLGPRSQGGRCGCEFWRTAGGVRGTRSRSTSCRTCAAERACTVHRGTSAVAGGRHRARRRDSRQRPRGKLARAPAAIRARDRRSSPGPYPMSGLLDDMKQSSAERVRQAMRRESPASSSSAPGGRRPRRRSSFHRRAST